MIALMRSGGMVAHWREAMGSCLRYQVLADALLIDTGDDSSDADKRLALIAILHRSRWSHHNHEKG